MKTEPRSNVDFSQAPRLVKGKACSNEILCSLPIAEWNSLLPYLQPQDLPVNRVLAEPHEPLEFAYFPNCGLASFVVPMDDGRTVEVGLVGKGGFAGTPLTFGVRKTLLRIVMQVAGDGFRIRAGDLQDVLRSAPSLRLRLGRYVLLQGMQAAQTAACNRLHELDQRLARWLLMIQDRVGPLFSMTQQRLAEALGTGRPSITLAARQMQKTQIIRYTRGVVSILNRDALEELSCECYSIISQFSAELNLAWTE
jgi:CRP-like cAMP-binding protein